MFWFNVRFVWFYAVQWFFHLNELNKNTFLLQVKKFSFWKMRLFVLFLFATLSGNFYLFFFHLVDKIKKKIDWFIISVLYSIKTYNLLTRKNVLYLMINQESYNFIVQLNKITRKKKSINSFLFYTEYDFGAFYSVIPRK